MKSPYSKTVGYELVHAARLHRARAAQLLSELGLFPGQEQVLTLLADEDRTMGDLAIHLRVRPPTASKTVARLAAQSLVERRSAPGGDGRVVRVGLTDEGRRRAAAVEEVWARLEGEMVEGLDGKDRKRLKKLLRKMGRTLGGQLGGAPAPAEDHAEDADE
ncbi:DNA-binding MarR family transcriptional regulator [Methylopila capsulata]|uniref:DNA-binding MarR family transcriptional regulator n=1 Tax=Methylopila capsulata TaxID=61654 RepID=A0A9W6ISM2_9HYPH|nr:MarR family transcriptional regulator [Methylopila capsulata]MBM7851308.1 DNA-binding MarR family transcriptional regulator [Methylopila capsulata]GLK54366.1 hypothetical protein GCM10008170_03850 [Methylopila capsulata]